MLAPDLIFELRSKGCSIIADGSYLDISPAENLPDEFIQKLRQNKPAILTELQREARQQQVLAMLEKNPGLQRAIYTDTQSDSGNVILTIAVRHLATCEMLIPKDRYDPFRLLELIEQHAGSIH
jgi:hypothetical protein